MTNIGTEKEDGSGLQKEGAAKEAKGEDSGEEMDDELSLYDKRPLLVIFSSAVRLSKSNKDNDNNRTTAHW